MTDEGYAQLDVSAQHLGVLVSSPDRKDRIAAAVELQAWAESGRIGYLEKDFVVTCAREPSTGDPGGVGRVRCTSMAAGELGVFEEPADEPSSAWLGAQVRAKLGAGLRGRVVLVSEHGELLWQDEAYRIRFALRTLAKDSEAQVLLTAVAALVAVVSADDGELGSLAIELLHDLLLRGAIPDVEVLAGAFEAIKDAAGRGSEPAVSVFMESLKHSVCKVRLLAVVGLEAPAKAGDERAFVAVLRSVSDPETQVSRAALDAIGGVVSAAEEGSCAAQKALSAQADALLSMLDTHTSVEVVAALGPAAGTGHIAALETLLELARHADQGLACSAVRGLAAAGMQRSGTGEELFSTFAAVAKSNADDGIRLQVVGSMGAMVKNGSVDVVPSLAEIVANESECNIFIRLEAVKGLGPAVQTGNDVATAAVLGLLGGAHALLRQAAAEAVAVAISSAWVLDLFSLECRGLVDAVVAARQDPDVVVRRVAVACLVSLCEKGHAASLAPLADAAADADEHVRREAVRALGELAAAGNAQATEKLLACAEDDSNLVRAEVAKCVTVLAPSNTRAKELLVAFEEDSDFLVSTAAQPGATITTEVGDAVSVVSLSYEAARLLHHGLAAAAVPMLQAAVEPGRESAAVGGDRSAELAITQAGELVRSKLELAVGEGVPEVQTSPEKYRLPALEASSSPAAAPTDAAVGPPTPATPDAVGPGLLVAEAAPRGSANELEVLRGMYDLLLDDVCSYCPNESGSVDGMVYDCTRSILELWQLCLRGPSQLANCFSVLRQRHARSRRNSEAPGGARGGLHAALMSVRPENGLARLDALVGRHVGQSVMVPMDVVLDATSTPSRLAAPPAPAAVS